MDRELAKRWLAGHVAAEQRSLEAMRAEGPPVPAIAFARSLELLDLAPADDRFRERDVAQARAAWAKLRAWAASHGKR